MPTRPIAASIVKKLNDAGYIAYFAGGWVRDFLMKRPSDDIDIATNASVHAVQELFSKTIPVGVAFGIVIVVEEGHQFEVASFRKDIGYIDGRRPTGVESATPEEDAERRDFTINGMFYDPIKNELFDYIGGQEDIKKGLIRAIGNPHERFREDRLRMMRAVRYSTRFDFPIEEMTLKAILDHASDLLPAVAIERIWQEFKKMAQFAHFDASLVMLHKLNLLQTIFPALKEVTTTEIERRVKAIPYFPKSAPPLAELLQLFPDNSLEELLALCDYLKLSKEERGFAAFYHHAGSLLKMPLAWQAKLELSEWAKFYANPHSKICIEIFALHLPPEETKFYLLEHEMRLKKLEEPVERIRTQNPLIKAEDLIKLGIKPSKRMGELLQEAEKIAINNELKDKEAVLSRLKLGE